MNILTIPLTALGVFVLCLTYARFGVNTTHESEQTRPGVELRQSLVHEHKLPSEELPHGKPAAAIALVTDGVQSLELMQSKKLDLVLQSRLGDGSVDIRLEAGGALQLLSASHKWTLDAATSPRIVLPIEVIAEDNGEHHLHIFIDHRNNDGKHTARALAIEFKVGAPEEMKLYSKHGTTATATAQPTNVVLKAEEEIF